jgi:hypothetical protein
MAITDGEDRADLVASRLRQGATRSQVRHRRLPSFALEHEMSGDLGHLHAAYDLTALPIRARARMSRPLVVRLRRVLLRGIYPIPEAQSVWNGANARVVSFLLSQLAAQARAIESLEQQVAQLYEDLHR